MPLTPGTGFGPYEVLESIGAGGMGEVYRARDTKLKRDVALKVLPEIFASDPSRLIRFQREAEVLASLNHPNIAQIYGVEERALAMELVDGDSPHGPMPFEEAWKTASQIADALEYAHDKGIVHRDLKPANVKVTPEGTVKLLDFGLAKAFNDLSDAPSPDPSNSPTLSLGATITGTVIGTAAYMAPEQAKGKPVDKRADIWAWGVVFYELLTGERLFQGEDGSEILAQVLTKQPDFERVPAKARRLLEECLQKDPKHRLRDIGDARRLVTNDVSPVSALQTGSRARLLSWIVSTAAILIAAVALLSLMRPPLPREPAIVRFTSPAAVSPVGTGLIAISRDGSRLAFVGGNQRQIYVRPIDQFDATPLAGTEDSMSLSFSPNGEWISYVSGYPSTPAVIKKVAVAGGPPQTITPAPALGGPPTQSWGMDDKIYFSADAGLQRIASGGGKAELLATPDSRTGERAYVSPELLPDGRHVLVSTLLLGRGPTAHRLLVFDAQNHEKKILLEDAGLASYTPAATPAAGHLLYYAPTSGSIMAVLVDLNRLEPHGPAVPVLEGIRSAGAGVGTFAVSESGTLAYVPGAPLEESPRTLVWVNRRGDEEATSCPSPRQYNLPRLSPDRDRVAIEIQNPGRGQADVWVCDLSRGSLSRITTGDSNTRAFWAGGDRIIYSRTGASDAGEIMFAPVDGGPPQVVANEGFVAYDVTPDGKFLIGNSTVSAALGRTVSILPIGNTSNDKKRSSDLQFTGTEIQFSTDGKMVAYQSSETGRPEVYVRAYPGPGGRETISTDGGTNPRWGRNGELFYRNGDKMMVVETQTSPVFRAGKPKVLFEKPYANGYDVTRDGKRFLMVKSGEARRPSRDQLNVVLNWTAELRRRVPLN